MRLSRFLLLAVTLLTSSLFASAQERCSLTTVQAPMLRNLRLGMSVEEIEILLKNVKGIVVPAHSRSEEKRGLLKVMISPVGELPGHIFSNIKTAKLEFMQEHVTAIELQFDNEAPWASVDEFVATVADTFELPTAWNRHGQSERRLLCIGFSIVAQKTSSSRLRLESVLSNGIPKQEPPQRIF